MANEKEAGNNKDSSRTKMIDKNMKDGIIKKITMGASRAADKVGFTQESQYADKTKEEMSQKKAKGGAIKKTVQKMIKEHASKPASKAHKGLKPSGTVRSNGCATKGKTKGRMR